jgi:hypothetical protein
VVTEFAELLTRVVSANTPKTWAELTLFPHIVLDEKSPASDPRETAWQFNEAMQPAWWLLYSPKPPAPNPKFIQSIII